MSKQSIMLRLDPETIANLDALAAQEGVSRNELAADVLAKYALPSHIVLGYFKLERGELDTEAPCIECGLPLNGEVFASLNSNGGHSAPLCKNCANSN